MELPTKAQIKADIMKNGVDASESLMLADGNDIQKWIDSGDLPEDASSWWDNAQEELRCLVAEFA